MTVTAARAHPATPAAALAHPSVPVAEPRQGEPSSAGSSAPFDVLVVGAGQAGLSMAWHLARRGVRYLLIDAAPRDRALLADPVGLAEVVHLGALHGLPDEGFPGAPDSYPSKDQVADYLAGYADRHGFAILTDTRVTRLVPYDGGLAAHTTQGILYARRVVVATGAFQVPLLAAARAGPVLVADPPRADGHRNGLTAGRADARPRGPRCRHQPQNVAGGRRRLPTSAGPRVGARGVVRRRLVDRRRQRGVGDGMSTRLLLDRRARGD
jgi:glycine/D-amino acid oxidase-like deaminating enzyme